MECSIFSRNGEDVIIGFLTGRVVHISRRFLEIGTSDGLQNNSFFLLKKGWSGVGIDAGTANIERYAQRVSGTPIAPRLRLSALKVG